MPRGVAVLSKPAALAAFPFLYIPLCSAIFRFPLAQECLSPNRQISWGRRACRECGGQRPGRERKPACHAGGLPKPGAVSLGNCSADAKATAAAKRREFWLKCDTFDQKNSRAGVAPNNGWRASLNFFPARRPCLCAPQGLHRSDALTGRGRPALPAPAPLF